MAEVVRSAGQGEAASSALRTSARALRQTRQYCSPRVGRGAGSSLPRLAAELPARLLLLDPTRGAVGMAEQMTTAVQTLGFDELVLLDVGGDALTTGEDSGLRSPLADQLVIAAVARTGLPARLVVAGAGLDGEIPAGVVRERLAQLDATELPLLTGAPTIRDVFTWHPSEASGLLAAAADGRRGYVEVRDAGGSVYLTDEPTRLAAVEVRRAIEFVPGGDLLNSTSLGDAERSILEKTGISEISYEAAKCNRRNSFAHECGALDLRIVDTVAKDAARRGCDFISTRRLAELLRTEDLYGYIVVLERLAEE